MSKRKEDKASEYADLYYQVKKIEESNKKLAADNSELAKRLNSKRYKVVDFVVDSAYKVARRQNRRKRLIEENLDIKIESYDSKNLTRNPVKGRVDIININFYDWDGKTLYKGGAERYVFDLACLLKKNGYKPRILQCSNVPFERKYRGITVVGIGTGDMNDMRKSSVAFSCFSLDSELIIASPLELACEITGVPVIGINHGINFDGDWNKYNKKYSPDYSVYMDALDKVVKCVCVDTNFINWTRTIDYRRALKEIFIPNYYNPEQFKNVNRKKQNDKVIFVYPRRIYNARGADITIDVFEKILEKNLDKIIINFVGQVDNEKIGKKLASLMSKYPKNVFHFEYDMSEMQKAYAEADVVLVPTRYCEGTSLSCIEGMVSGAAIITTNVGGLPNLVIDRYNGRLISPTADELEEAVLYMITHPEERRLMAKNGQEVAKAAFNKNLWDLKWIAEIDKVLK